MGDDAADRIESAVESVERAVERVEKAVNNKWSTVQWLVAIFVGIGLWSLPGEIWHAKWRYALSYDVQSSDVYIQDQPHDCSFFAAPLGAKFCHYERTFSVTRWATSQTGSPIVSYDDGKTWDTLDPEGKEVPKYSTVKEVLIRWEKKED